MKIESKWPLAKLLEVAEIISGGTPDTKNPDYWDGDIPWLSIEDFNSGARYVHKSTKKITKKGLENSSTKYLNKGDIIISARGTVGAMGQLTMPMTFNQSCYGLRGKRGITNDYLYFALKLAIEQLRDNSYGAIFGAITIKTFDLIKIPLPPMDVQGKIVAEIEKIEKDERDTESQIESLKISIEAKLNALHNRANQAARLGDDDLFHVSIGQRVLKSQLIPDGKYPVYSANVFEAFGRINDSLITDFDSMSVIWGIDGDWMVNTVPENTPFYPTDHCGVLRVKKPDIIHEKYLAYALLREGKRIGFSRSKRASTDKIRGIKVPLPSYKAQKQIAAEIQKIETQIADLQEKLAQMPQAKDAVLKKYL